MTREEMTRLGYCAISKSSELHPWGYQIVEWFSPRLAFAGLRCQLYEYVPRPDDPRNVHNRGKVLLRHVAFDFDDQVAIHEEIGAWKPSLIRNVVERTRR